jgi:aryl-alcohol dehydrogenase
VRAAFFGQSSFSTYSLVTERNSMPVAPDAPLHYLAGFTCGVQTGAGAILNAMPVSSRSRVAVWGAGAVGLAAVMAARVSGAAEIVAVDRVASRLALAAEPGATVTIDTTDRELPDITAAVLKATGRGRFPVERLVRNYPFEQLSTAIADSLAGTTVKPVLTFG